jgi:VIT1/CCC1 family predicted Fe2+/Mn2+ transporter
VVSESDPGPGPEPGTAAASPGAHVHPAHPEHHRQVQGGAARAAVFGVSDGLVSNMGLILGVAGADPVPAAVRLAGVAGLVAGAISMGAGEYNSMRVQADLLQRELDIEERELIHRPEFETDELAGLYERRGLPPEGAHELAEAVMSDPGTALEAHAREELGVDPNELGRPLSAAVSSFFSFTLGALVPLAPWFFGGGTGAIVASLVLGVAAAAVVGVIIGRTTARPWWHAVGRQVLFTLVPAVITYMIGTALGVELS